MFPRYLTGLDIGSASIKAVIGEFKKNGQLTLVRAFRSPSAGMRRGSVEDLAEMTRSLNQLFLEIRNVSKDALKNIILNIGGPDVKLQTSKGIVAVSRADFEIYQDDIDRVVQASQAINLPPNRMIIHSMIREYLVDGVGDIQDPIGMIGNRLEVNSIMIDAFTPRVKNLTKCVEMAGGGMNALIVAPLAASRSVLSRNQKELGVAVVDIGFGTTGICMYEENKLLHRAILPVGSGNITNDLAIGLRTNIDVAETVKLSFGTAIAKGISVRENIDLRKVDANIRVNPSRKFIAEVIQSRLAEIFEFVDNELKTISRAGRLPAGVVLVGGGTKLPGIVDLAREELQLPAQIGIPDTTALEVLNGELNLQLEDPEFACAMGLVMAGHDRLENKTSVADMTGMWKKIIGQFLP